MSGPLHVSGGVGSVQVDVDALLPTSAAFADLAVVTRETSNEISSVLCPRVGDAVTPAVSADLVVSLRALAGALALAADDAQDLAGLLFHSQHIYRSTEGMLLDPIDRIGVSFGRLTLGTLELSAGQDAAARSQFAAALPELTDGAAWLVGAPLEVLYALWFGGGTARVADLGADTRPAATTPPRSLADVMAQLALRNTGRHGEISVSFVVGHDGVRRAIVDIPGTKSWNPAPTHDVTGVGTDAVAINGGSTAYEQGVLQALERAGVGPDMPVMLVGHSLGGIVAVNVARTARATGRFDVTHVVTAGAPIGRVVGALPKSVSVLAFENSSDIVPATDGVGNPSTPTVTTVTVDAQHGSIGANHDLGETYQPEAAAADASDDPSITAFVDSAGEFLDATGEVTNAYWITRS